MKRMPSQSKYSKTSANTNRDHAIARSASNRSSPVAFDKALKRQNSNAPVRTAQKQFQTEEPLDTNPKRPRRASKSIVSGSRNRRIETDPIDAVRGRGVVLASVINYKWPNSKKRPYLSENLTRLLELAGRNVDSSSERKIVRSTHVVHAINSSRHAKEFTGSAFLNKLPNLGFAEDAPSGTNKTKSSREATVLSPEVMDILALASQLRARTNINWEDIGLRHLIAALYLTETGRTAISKSLIQSMSYVSSRDAYMRFLRDNASLFERLYDDQSASWSTIVKEISATQYAPPYAGYVPSFSNDRTFADLIGMERDAQALAALCSLKELTPPMAIGLFGPWGSGKSTFMNFIQDRVRTLTDPATNPDGFRILQIEFDAWSHADAENLWASLTAGLFDQIGEQLSAEAPNAGAALMKAIARRIGSDSSKIAPELKDIENAEQELRAKRDGLENARTMATPRLAAASGLVNELATAAKTDDASKDRLTQLSKSFGINNVDPEALAGAASTLLAMPSKVALGALLARRNARSPEIWGYAMAAVVGVFALAVLFWKYADPALFEDYLAASPWLAMVMGLLVGAARIATVVIAPVLKFGADFDERVRMEEKNRRESILAAENALTEAQKRLDELNSQKSAAETFAVSYGPAAEGRSPAGLLRYFITYSPELAEIRKKLGLLSTVRRCFETLEDIMRGLRQGETNDAIPPEARIDRIIVYIDDLDRCSENHVVQVLQAVQLLLAFELFVVVVAVDARWLEAAVSKVHGEQLAAPNAPAGSATVADYLEKIFQLPVWIRPLGGTTVVRQFIDGVDRPETPLEAPDSKIASGVNNSTLGKHASSFKTEEVEVLPMETLRIAASRATLSAMERDIIEAMGELAAKSPRGLKRLVNSYRLMRVLQTEAESIQTVQGSNGEAPSAPFILFALACEVGLSGATIEAILALLKSDTGKQDTIRQLAIAVRAETRLQKVRVADSRLNTLGSVVRNLINAEDKLMAFDAALSAALASTASPKNTGSLRSRTSKSAYKELNPNHPAKASHLIWAFEATARYSFHPRR